jgi:hypothetical protein
MLITCIWASLILSCSTVPTTSLTIPNNASLTPSNSTPITPATLTPISPELARIKALEFVSTTYNVAIDILRVYEQEPVMISQITKEMVQYLVIGDGHDFYIKLFVDMNYKVWEASQYRGSTGKSDQEIAGNLNIGLYNYLQDKTLDFMVKVMIVVSLHSELATELPKYIESKGYKITSIGDTDSGRFIYAKLNKETILELAKRDGIYIQQDLPTSAP